MNIKQMTGALALVASSGALWAIPTQGLTRVPPTHGQALVRSEWQPVLTDPDLDKREQAYANLMDLVRTRPSARGHLEEWAQDPTDPLLAWTSRLALRELRLQERDTGSPWGRLGQPRRSPFGDDFGVHGLLEQLQHDLDQLQGRMGGLSPLIPFHPPGGALPPGGAPGTGIESRSDGFSMQMTPDGVKIEIRKQVDGDEEVRTYEGDTLEELLEANPELEPYVNSRGFQGVPTRPRGVPLLRTPSSITPRDRSVLGVLAEVREEGGLVIGQVLPDTIADDLELLVDEVVLEINGTPIRVHADVRRALSASAPDEPIVVTILDTVGKRKDLTWTPR